MREYDFNSEIGLCYNYVFCLADEGGDAIYTLPALLCAVVDAVPKIKVALSLLVRESETSWMVSNCFIGLEYLTRDLGKD